HDQPDRLVRIGGECCVRQRGGKRRRGSGGEQGAAREHGCPLWIFGEPSTKEPTLRRPLVTARGLRLGPFSLSKSEGDGALDGAGAIDGRARWPASRSSRSPENSAGDHRPMTGTGAPSGAPSRRF